MPPPAQGWSKSLEDADPRLRAAHPLVRSAWCARYPARDLHQDYTWRSAAFQFELFKIGRALRGGIWVVVDKSKVVTSKDGSKPSRHQSYPAQAMDVYYTQGGAIVWPPADENKSPAAEAERDAYRELGGLWQEHGLTSGALWPFNWKDWPHVQTA